MSSTTIEQLLQITTPVSPGREAARDDQGGKNLFRDHLQRATDISEGEQAAIKESRKPATTESTRLDDDADLESQTEQDDTTTAQHEESPSTVESSEAPGTTSESTNDASGENASSDELTLSTEATTPAAANDGDPTFLAPTASIAASRLEPSTPEAAHAPQKNATTATAEASIATATIGTADPESGQLGTELANGAAGTDGNSPSDAKDDEGAAQKRPFQTAKALSTSTTEPITTEDAQAQAKAQQETDEPSQQAVTTKAQSESETTERRSQRSERLSPQPTSTQAIAGSSVVTDIEPSNASTPSHSQLNASEGNAPTPSTPAASASHDTIAIAQRSLGNPVSGKSATQASESRQAPTDTPTIDRARFVHRVGGAIRTAQQRDGQIQLRLSPPELGTLRIQISVLEGAVTAHLETETATARTVLLDNLPALRERLAEQDIRIEKFDVDVGREGQQQTDNREAEERENFKEPAQRVKTAKRQSGPTSIASEARTRSGQSNTSELDVRI